MRLSACPAVSWKQHGLGCTRRGPGLPRTEATIGAAPSRETAIMNPLHGNPFRDRADAQEAVLSLFLPLVPAYEAGGARVKLGVTATTYDAATAELEAFARPLWGVAPLAAGGAPFPYWDLFRTGLARGTD